LRADAKSVLADLKGFCHCALQCLAVAPLACRLRGSREPGDRHLGGQRYAHVRHFSCIVVDRLHRLQQRGSSGACVKGCRVGDLMAVG